MSTIQRFFLKSALRLPHAVIPVNNNIRQAVEVIANRSVESVISPYLEPLDEPHQQQADLPESLKKFIQTQGIPLIVACASSTSKYRGCDLYGVDMCIKLGRFLHRQAKPFNMVLCLTVTTDEKYLDTMKKQIRTANLGSNVLLYEGSLNFQALLQEATLFVRPVASDGQPLSLIEAISSGVPSVASDVCERPSGCVVFASRDQNAFNKKCLAILNNPSLHFPDPKIADQLDGFTKIYTLYQSLLS